MKNKPWQLGLCMALLVGLTLPLLACSEPVSKVYRTHFLSMGTLVDISIANPNHKLDRAAVHKVKQALDRFDTEWNPWGTGELAKLNKALAAGGNMTVSNDMAAGIAKARRLQAASHGFFDPGVGGFVRLWQFNLDERPAGAPPPPPSSVAALLASHPSIADINIEKDSLRGRNQAVTLDFGGFAKGLAVDRAIRILRQHGIHNAIVNAGGDLRAIGQHFNRPWRIGIENPRGQHGGAIAWVAVQGNESVFTSGDYERYFIWHGKRYCHIFDPSTGYPVQGVTSVTVIHSDASTADAAATALFVAGPRRWYGVARSMGIKYVMLISSSGEVYMNPAMAKRIHFVHSPLPKIHLSPPL